MSKLEELKDLVAKAFEGAENKESIESLANINNKLNEVQLEEQALTEKNAELIKSYKDLVQHTSFKDDGMRPAAQNDIAPAPISFEEALQAFAAANPNAVK